MSLVKPDFLWAGFGDQESKIHKLCPMGEYLLEVFEHGFNDDSELVFVTSYCQFDQTRHAWEFVKRFPETFQNVSSAKEFIENWYSLNIATDTILLGAPQ